VKAVVQVGYGVPADALTIADVERPQLGDRDVLVRVASASVNALDWHMTRGIPKVIRMTEGQPAPRKRIRGVDLAGQVEAVGKDVTAFRPGDHVFGGAEGSFAEYAATTADRLAQLPGGFTHEQAATLCLAGLTALQAVRDKARVRAGQRLIVNGAGGGVGTFVVQLAKWLGAHVTAVTRTEHVEVVRSIGADEVVDYSREDFTRRGERYDALVSIGGNPSLSDCWRVLRPSGSLVVVGGPVDRLLIIGLRLVVGAVLAPVTRRRAVGFITKNQQGDLVLLKQLAEAGKLRPVIDRRYALSQGADAIAYVGSGRVRGKVVIIPDTPS
jgi:NADPH:quinone reductase-like Zn-dependent oxidoreductase